MSHERRVGIGYDVHRVVGEGKLVLGGVEVDAAFGLEGHSDADVVAHAVTDALLGAAGLGDIGDHFPNTAERYRGADSIELLTRAMALVSERGWRVGNVDATVLAEQPELSALKDEMAGRLARALGVSATRVNVKATTNEGLGFIGRGEGIAAFAVVLIERER